MLERHSVTGRFVETDERCRTKTQAGMRHVPSAEELGRLLEDCTSVSHSDLVAGRMDGEARLLPGVGKDDVSGQVVDAIERVVADQFEGSGGRGGLRVPTDVC